MDPQVDQSLSLRLLNSGKSRHEHALVVSAIREALTPLCDVLDVPDSPSIIKLRNLQHLWTGVTGTLRHGLGLFDVARRLHPTPAVAGAPAHAACDWLKQEGLLSA